MVAPIPSARDELHAAVPGGGVVFDPDVLERYRRDQATWSPAGRPMALARPSCTAEVQALARWATRHRIPLVPRGVMEDAIALGGTITGEHGVVVLERRFLPRQLGPAVLALQARIQQAFDPDGILNPGKVFPDRAPPDRDPA